MILRIRTPEGALRLEVDPVKDQTIQHLMNKIEGFGNDFSLSNNPANKRPFTPSTVLTSIPLKHGDMLFLAPGKSFAAARAQQHDDTKVTQQQPSFEAVEIDQVDRLLEKQTGLITRPKDSNFCRHGVNAMCDYCMPLEPYDQRYLEERKIKHLSFHAYIKKLTSADKNQAGGSGAATQYVAALEEPSYVVDRNCSAGHQPYPLSMCAKCQPSAIILQQQTFRMVDHVEFEDPKIVDNFISFWRQTGLQRFGYLYGRYAPYTEVPLGIKAIVSAIYEPPQKPAVDGVELESDPHESSVEHVARSLGLQVVGMIYTDLIDDGSGTGKVLCRRHPDSFFLSSAEIAFIAQHQLRHPNRTRLTPTHRFGSKFVTVVVSGDTEQQIHLSAFQVSNTAMGMIRDHVIDASMSATQMRVRRSTRDQYVPDVFYKYKNEYGTLVQGKADPMFPVEYLLVTLTEGFPQRPEPLFRSVEFPIENRGGLAHQDMETVKAKLMRPDSSSIIWEAVSDFHMLIYLKFSGLFSEDDFNNIGSLVTSGKLNESELNGNSSWQTLLMILKEMTTKSAPPPAKSSTTSTDFQQMRPEEILQQLNAPAAADKLRAVRSMKNSIIGNKTKKNLFVTMGVVPKLVSLLQDPDQQLAIQVAVSLGSFAYGNDQIVEQLIQNGAVSPLLSLLGQDKDSRLQESAARSLKALLQNSSVPRDEIFREKNINSLMKLLMQVDKKQGTSAPAELAAAIIARCCETSDQQNKFVQAGSLRWLMQMLAGENLKAQESAADALASLCRDNQEIGRQIVSLSTKILPAESAAAQQQSAPSDIVAHLLHLVHDKRPTMRLLAATCLSNLHRCQAIPQERSQEILVTLLPCLVKLFSDPSLTIKEKAPLILAYLVSESEEMQKLAADADAIPKLAQLLQWADEQQSCTAAGSLETRGLTDRLIESSLLALAAVCSLKEECRKLVIDAKVLPIVIKALEHKNVAIRAAACQCTRSLSRSVKNLRTSLVDSGIAMPLFKLLSDDSVSVKTTASATLCNIVLDFSPMKKTVIENGGVEKLAALVSSMDSNLRLNAVWALKNLLFQAESDIKTKVMHQLTYPTLKSLMHDSEIGIQEQSLNLLRNLACGNETDIQSVFEGMQEESLMQLLDEKLRMPQEEIVLQTLYVIVNISTGNERHKAAIIKHPTLLQHILNYMGNSPCAVRVATIWCLINLTWPEDKGSEERVSKLKSMGFEEKLKAMEDDPDLDVKDRVKTALQHFQNTGPPRQATAVDVQMADN